MPTDVKIREYGSVAFRNTRLDVAHRIALIHIRVPGFTTPSLGTITTPSRM
jgi:hypothetical protein